jgi:hypothetical protein
MELINTLAYYDAATIAVSKRFLSTGPWGQKMTADLSRWNSMFLKLSLIIEGSAPHKCFSNLTIKS